MGTVDRMQFTTVSCALRGLAGQGLMTIVLAGCPQCPQASQNADKIVHRKMEHGGVYPPLGVP